MSAKRIFTFAALPSDMQAAAIAKVQRLAELTAREHGEIWIESSADLARAATFTVCRDRITKDIVSIWTVWFATAPRVMPGTERPTVFFKLK